MIQKKKKVIKVFVDRNNNNKIYLKQSCGATCTYINTFFFALIDKFYFYFFF